MVKQALGNVAEDESFWNCESEIELLVKRLKQGQHIQLVAPRRMGKTSLLHEAVKHNEISDHFISIFIDLEDCEGPEDFVTALSMKTYKFRSLEQQVYDLFENTLAGIQRTVDEIGWAELKVKLRAGIDAGNWKEKGRQLLEILRQADKRVVVMLDELPILLNRILKQKTDQMTVEGKNEADIFLTWLRKQSQNYQDEITFTISGSIGLNPVLHKANLTANLNNFDHIALEPWDNEVAENFIKSLAEEYDVEIAEAAISTIIELLGSNIPHHVQVFFKHLQEKYMKNENEITTEIVQEIYEQKLLGPVGYPDLKHYEERLGAVFDDEELSVAMTFLTEAAVNEVLTYDAIEYMEDNTDLENSTQEILSVLVHDGYLNELKEGYKYNSNFIKDWWERKFGHNYVSILKEGAEQ